MSDNLEAQLKELTANLARVLDETKRSAETMHAEIKNLGSATGETKQAADQSLLELNTLKAQVADLEQRAARRGRDDQPEIKSLGQQVVDDAGVKAALAEGLSFRGRARVEVKTITSAAGSAAALVRNDRQPGILVAPERRMTVRDLLMPGQTASNGIEYVRELLFTNSAAPVAENTLKPESNITFEQASAPVRTIAHWLQSAKQILADAPQLMSFIDGRLRYGLRLAEEAQLLFGSGTGQNILGIVPQATAYAAPGGITVANATPIDQIRLMLLQATLAEYPADGIVMHPTDWTRVELTKDTAGGYIFANPQAMSGPTLWGQPVVATQAMTLDKVLVGSFRMGAQIFDREDATVLISTEDRDNFVKNMVTVLAEERLALAVYRPAAFVYGDLGFVA